MSLMLVKADVVQFTHEGHSTEKLIHCNTSFGMAFSAEDFKVKCHTALQHL